MFAGEGDAARTNRRFHLLAEGQPSTRLSTAFDSVTLYGFDPDERPDIFGKVGNAGRLGRDDRGHGRPLRRLRPVLAVDVGLDDDQRPRAGDPRDVPQRRGRPARRRRPRRAARAARSTDDERAAVRAEALATVRGTVQADILKEDQGQNTCILSTEFALRMMGDVQQYFVDHDVRELLLGLDLGLPHRRGRGEPDHPARAHAVERLHLRRGVARARAWTSRTSRRRSRSSSRTAWTPSTRCSAASRGGSGRS